MNCLRYELGKILAAAWKSVVELRDERVGCNFIVKQKKTLVVVETTIQETSEKKRKVYE